MADDTPPADAPGEPAMVKLTAESFPFPEAELTQWVDIPSDEPLNIGPLTRADLDHLLFSHAKTARAIRTLQEALIDFSNGKTESANALMLESGNKNIEGESDFRRVFYSIMQSVLKGRQNGSR